MFCRMLRRCLCALVLGASAFLLPAQAWAGYGVQPAPGTATGVKPTFLVYLDPTDSAAQVYVSTSTALQSDGTPADEVGSCTPTTPFGEPGKYTCRPGSYGNNNDADALPAGNYYWFLSYQATDADHPFGTTVVSGPFGFTVTAPTQPTGVFQVSPADGAATSATPTLSYHVPANVPVDVYVSESPDHLDDGSPPAPDAHCSATAQQGGTSSCAVPAAAGLRPGATYYWWLVVAQDDSTWISPARSFTIRTAPVGGGPGGGAAHALSDAPYLPSSAHFTGPSVKQTRLSKAAYGLSKLIGAPKTIAVACWGTADWQAISGDNPENFYSVLGFWAPAMPHWLQLSPRICNAMETLVYKRPRYANRFTANAVDTLTHEMIHALGVRNEAATECYAMQLSWVSAENLGVPASYAYSLSRLTLANYGFHPPSYVDRADCREDGALDLFKGRPSLPWHNFQV